MKRAGTLEAFVHAACRFLFFTGKGGISNMIPSCNSNHSGGQWTPRVLAGSISFGCSDG